MDKYFTTLDELSDMEQSSTTENISDSECCTILKNHIVSNGLLLCNACNNTISNIIDGPEWRYYGSNDTKSTDPTRCGMPVNELLPESSVGTSISMRGGN